MRPHLDRTGFGWLEIDGHRYEHDVLIRLDGEIEKRKKKLSKRIYGTSHTVSRDEAKHVFEKHATTLIVGTGQYDNVRLSPEAEEYFRDHKCDIHLLPTPAAIGAWNAAPENAIGLFHVTC
ncbi:MAG: hypothetical protein HY700_19685 [Gemmatimonadetes bacterium]|nr:hypothetical protein [Gemmatimonadota bacterium]